MDLELIQELKGHGVQCVAVHPNSKVIAAGYDDGEVKIWKKGGGGRFCEHEDFGGKPLRIASGGLQSQRRDVRFGWR